MANAELQHHIQVKRGDVGRYVLLPGDPGRCEKVASYFDDPQLIASNREYKTYTGTLLGEKVSVTSTGIGSPSAAIAIEELCAVGTDTFIRVGTSGGMQPHLQAGDLGIIWGAIRDEGTTKHYMPVEFPAVADLTVVSALQQAAQELGYRCHTGIAHSKDSFYGQHQPERMPVADELIERWHTWRAGGAICAEMETAVLFVLSSIYRKRAGSVLLVAANQTGADPHARVFDPTPAIHTALEAVKILIQKDKET
jgi:uridine phosphorylase